MQLSPNSQIPVSYTASIPGDTTLYYVQAVLRDTQSGTTLQTLNLTNVSSTPNRYQGVFSAVSDPSGLGRPIDITITVYTDSGHTTPSFNYQILQLNYTILQPWIANLGMGGGMNIDYEKIQKMFDGKKIGNEEIGNEVARKIPPVDYDRLSGDFTEATENARTALSKEFSGHAERLSGSVSEISRSTAEAREAHGKSVEAILSRMQTLEGKLGEGQKLSSKERNSVKSELSKLIQDIKPALTQMSEASARRTEALIQKGLEEIKESLLENLKEGMMGKEIHLTYNSEKPQKKEKPQYSPDDDVAALLRYA